MSAFELGEQAKQTAAQPAAITIRDPDRACLCEPFGDGIRRHNYHIFPMWYRDTWKLVDELGIAGSFVDCEGFFQLSPRQYATADYHNLTSLRYAWRNLRAGSPRGPGPQQVIAGPSDRTETAP